MEKGFCMLSHSQNTAPTSEVINRAVNFTFSSLNIEISIISLFVILQYLWDWIVWRKVEWIDFYFVNYTLHNHRQHSSIKRIKGDCEFWNMKVKMINLTKQKGGLIASSIQSCIILYVYLYK